MHIKLADQLRMSAVVCGKPSLDERDNTEHTTYRSINNHTCYIALVGGALKNEIKIMISFSIMSLRNAHKYMQLILIMPICFEWLNDNVD